VEKSTGTDWVMLRLSKLVVASQGYKEIRRAIIAQFHWFAVIFFPLFAQEIAGATEKLLVETGGGSVWLESQMLCRLDHALLS